MAVWTCWALDAWRSFLCRKQCRVFASGAEDLGVRRQGIASHCHSELLQLVLAARNAAEAPGSAWELATTPRGAGCPSEPHHPVLIDAPHSSLYLRQRIRKVWPAACRHRRTGASATARAATARAIVRLSQEREGAIAVDVGGRGW